MTARRVLAMLLVAALAGAGAVFAQGEEEERGGEVAVDVVFDDARGLIPGQLVQIAGAQVGHIEDVSVTPDRKARIHMRVDARFAPFRRDARCTIKPQGLIAENYVDCNPGTPGAPPLEGRDGEAPTVPVERTTQPVSLTDLFEVWNVPTSQRLSVLMSTLGIATAGRGEDINAILRRANPTLAMARRTIRILTRQGAELEQLLDDSGTVAAALAEDPAQLTALTRHAGRVAARSASQRGALAEGLARLPALLEEMPPALERLDAAMEAGTPMLADVERSAPSLTELSDTVPRLRDAAAPVLRAYAPVLRRGARVARRTAPLTELMANYAAASLPNVRIAGEMLPALDERGLNRSLLTFFFNMALAAARYDEAGHLLPAHVTPTRCTAYAEAPDPGCDGTQSAPAEARATPQAAELLEYLLG
jgi:virulence factor Mce-like protein